MQIYFAAPLFCREEQEYNLVLATKLENYGFTVFLPQRDGVELKEELFRNHSEEKICQEIFILDRNEIIKADLFLMILDGRVPDEGTCVELGIAHENKFANNKEKMLIGYSTDMRVFSDKFKFNAMLLGALDYVIYNEDDLFEKIIEFRNEYSEENVTFRDV